MKIIGKGILYLLFATWIVLLVVCLTYCKTLGWIEDENFVCLFILIGGALSLLLFFRPKCKRKWTRITRNVFAVVLLLSTLIFEIWAVVDIKDEVDYDRRITEEIEVTGRMRDSIINDLESDDDALVDAIIWAIHNNELREIVNERDSNFDYYDTYFWAKCEHTIESACKRTVERRAKEGNANAEYINGEDYYDEWYKKHTLDWISSEELNEMMEHAFYWWSHAASHGCPQAYTRMAQCYEGMIKIPTLYTNKQIAFDWWRKLADADYSSGYYNMGRMMIESDKPAEAKQYWKIAADMGNKAAKNALEKLYSDDVQPGAKKDNPPL